MDSNPQLATEVQKPRENQAVKVGKKVVSLVPVSSLYTAGDKKF